MSRFDGDYEPRDDGKDVSGLWSANLRRALAGKRGQAALRDLRDALLALPEKRLIEGALCTVGLGEKVAAMPAQITVYPYLRGAVGFVRDAAAGLIRDMTHPELVNNWDRSGLIQFTEEHEDQPEGVCAVGAYIWWRKVKAGMDPAEAFASLPVLPDTDSGEWETADAGKDAGLTATLAYELAYRNDDTWGGLTPEARYERFMAWIETQLAAPTLP